MSYNDEMWEKLASECEEECKCSSEKCSCTKEAFSIESIDLSGSDLLGDSIKASWTPVHAGRVMGGEQLSGVLNLVIPKGSPRLVWPPQGGDRVAFATQMDAQLTYRRPPEPGATGTVLKIRTASGDTTHQDGQAFVKWDTGDFSVIHRDHLYQIPEGARIASADSYRITVASLGNISAFFQPVAGIGPDLVHKATQDLWALSKGTEGYTLERLFDAEGDPLKV